MNNKEGKNTYLSTIESKKQNKLTSRTETASWIQRTFFGSCQEEERLGGWTKKVNGLRSTN